MTLDDSSDTATDARGAVSRYLVNKDFNQAILVFEDGSQAQFEHTSLTSRWAQASSEDSLADTYCRLLQSFRLNSKHLQLFFEDGSDAEFFVGD